MKNLRVELCNTFCSPCSNQGCDECPLHDLIEERDSICALLGVEDPLKGVEATLEKLARARRIPGALGIILKHLRQFHPEFDTKKALFKCPQCKVLPELEGPWESSRYRCPDCGSIGAVSDSPANAGMWWNWTRESDYLKQDLRALLKDAPDLVECPECAMKRPAYQDACLFCMMTDSQELKTLKEAVNTFPLGLLMSGENAEGKREHRFVNLVTQRTSPAYEDVVRALLAGHEFYKENPGFILEVTSVGVSLPGPIEQGECDG